MAVGENDKPMFVGLVESNKTEQIIGLESLGDIINRFKKIPKQKTKKPFSLAMIKIRGENQVMMISEKTWENEVCWDKYFGMSRYYSAFHSFSVRRKNQDYLHSCDYTWIINRVLAW